MSRGSLLGGLAGGVVGFFVGGPIGALWGAAIGFGVGAALDPMQPDTPAPGQMAMDVQITTAKYGDPIPDILGTIKLTGNIIWYCCDHVEEVTEEAEAGKGGGSSATIVTGVKYYMSWAMALCMGPVDAVYTIYKEDEVIWEGKIERPGSGGVESIVLDDLETTIEFYFGTDDQEAPEELCKHLRAGNVTGGASETVSDDACDNDDYLNVPYRNVCWVYVPDAYIGGYNRAPTLRFVVKKRPTITDEEDDEVPYANIGAFDYNPAHAVWYIQETMAGLPKSFMNSDSFAEAAETLSSEGRGISALIAQRQPALTYIESVNAHADMIERFGIDGKLHLKLLRAPDDADSLPLIDESVLVEDPSVERESRLSANDEVKVIFSERIFNCTAGADLDFDDSSTSDSISANSSIDLYISGGCPPFEWEIVTEDSGCSLGEAETDDRENTLTSGNCPPDEIEIIVTDSIGESVTFYIAGVLPSFTFDDDSTPDSVDCGGSISLYVLGGQAPFSWEVTSGSTDEERFTLAFSVTTGEMEEPRTNTLSASICADAEVSIRVTDACGSHVDFDIATNAESCPDTFQLDDDATPDTITPGSYIDVFVDGGEGPFTWDTESNGYSFTFDETTGRSNRFNVVGGTCGVDYDVYGTFTVTDVCGATVIAIVRATSGSWGAWNLVANIEYDTYCPGTGRSCTNDGPKHTRTDFPGAADGIFGIKKYKYEYHYGRTETCYGGDPNDCCGDHAHCGYAKSPNGFLCYVYLSYGEATTYVVGTDSIPYGICYMNLYESEWGC